MKLQVSIHGLQAIQREMQRLAKQYPESLAAALYMEGMEIWRGSVPRAPVEHNVLRTSAYVAPPTQRGGRIEGCEIGFGTAYAVPQHERLDYKHPRGGEAKYLEKTVNERLAGMLERLGSRTRDLAARKVGIQAIPAIAPKRPQG